MKAFSARLYTFSVKFIQISGALLTGLLFLGGFLFTCYAENMDTQKVLIKWDNPVFSVPCTALLLAVCIGLTLFSLKHFPKASQTKFLLFFVCSWYLLLGAILVVFGKTVPAADAMSVYDAAKSLAFGDTSVIHPTDSYLSYYPQQVGLMAYFEFIIRLLKLLPAGLPYYHFIKCINVGLACVILLFQYKTVHLIWNNLTADRFYLVMAAFNAPFIMYTSFVYGEIPSFAAVSVGIYFTLKLMGIGALDAASHRKSHLLYGILSLLFLTLGVMLRKNSLILIIAVLITATLQALKHKQASLTVQTGLALWTLICAAACFSILPIVQKGYELRAANTLKSGVPAMSYLAMGMQESSRGNGWYNGFNFNTYQETGMDKEAAAALSKQAISLRLDYFAEHPGDAADFYAKKHLSQWADGTYACRQATLATFGGRTAFFNELYEGKYSGIFIEYCNLYQNLVYMGAFLFCLSSLWAGRKTVGKSKKNSSSTLEKHLIFARTDDTNPDGSAFNLPAWLGMIGVLGGFLFHIFWEANSRYIFPYGLLLLPYSVTGLAAVITARKRQPSAQSAKAA